MDQLKVETPRANVIRTAKWAVTMTKSRIGFGERWLAPFLILVSYLPTNNRIPANNARTPIA
jgi:hypothetical protein